MTTENQNQSFRTTSFPHFKFSSAAIRKLIKGLKDLAKNISLLSCQITM